MTSLSSVQSCRVCQGPVRFLWLGDLLDIKVSYYRCDSCGYVQTEKPYWLERAYAEAINDSDTGIMARNMMNARIVLATLWVLGSLKGRVVDFAGGYGILVRLLRDYGVDALWSDQYCQNLVVRGFEYREGRADLVTAFEVFEHFVEPARELDRLLEIAPNVLISTELIPEPVPQPEEWWYYGREHGQHIGFFTVESLQKLASARGKFLLTDGRSYHLFTDNPSARLLWRPCLRFLRLMPFLARLNLQPKTWSDHLLISGRSK